MPDRPTAPSTSTAPASAKPPTLKFPPELPVSARVDDIIAAVRAHPVVLVAGATGSGKSTQLPKIAMAMGRGAKGLIGVTQPRRIAATSVASRVAREVESPVGETVGYQIRFENRTSRDTAVKFMTDGVLLAEINGDPLLRRYDTLIIDEAHERSLTIDFLLGWLKRILPKRRDLKVIVSSATLEIERFSQFFDKAPVVEVEGRTFPVDVLYEPPSPELDMADAVAEAVDAVTSLDPHGDILVFLPGEREIREAEAALTARALRNTLVQPLYARLSAAEQSRVFAQVSERRVILATNVAETSVTIPGIVYVIDTGVARLSRYDPRSGTTKLQIEAISQASANQRKGRCGRVREGVCVRLYDETSFNARPAFTDPELQRTGLAAVILRMKSLRLGDVEGFPFLDPPAHHAIVEGYRVLEELGALDAKRELTPLGEQLARFPVDPRIARMIVAGAEGGCLRDVLVIAAALNVQDVRERPRDAAQHADEMHRPFRDERSDFASLLKVWEFLRSAESRGTSHLRRTCRDNFLSFLRYREWRDLHRQLEDTVRELRLPKQGDGPVSPDAVHKAILTGLLSKVGQFNPESRVYMGARQTRFAMHPSSNLARKPPAWVMAFELVETNRLFARTAAKIEPEWLLDAASHLIKRSHSDPHWSERSARATVKESATLYGLQVFRDRTVDYASVSPAQARLMFLDHALVRGEYKSRGNFQAKNRDTLAAVEQLRDKARRSTMLADEDALLTFFDTRVPLDVTNGKEFEAWREAHEAKEPNALVLTMKDVLVGEPDLVPEHFPDAIKLNGVSVPVEYRFDLSAPDDGITLTIPLILLPQLEPGALDWTVRGWMREKITALLGQLSRAERKGLGSLTELAALLAEELTPFDGRLVPTLVEKILALTGVEIEEETLSPASVAAWLRVIVRVVDEGGKVVAQGRDADELIERYGARARAAWKQTPQAPSAWERKGITSWDFPELPEFVKRRVGGVDVRSYPAIVDRGASVDLALLENAGAASRATHAGVRRLVLLASRGFVSTTAPRIPQPFPRLDGTPHAKSDIEAFRGHVLARIADDATGLSASSFPRTKGAFDGVVRQAAQRFDASFQRWASVVSAASSELANTLAALRNAAKHPSGTAASKEIRAQLAHLFPERLIETVPLTRLVHYPRYLRAAQTRLSRAVSDPQKDAGKLAPFAELWGSFLRVCANAKDQEAAAELRWNFEELRVAIFAPELTTAVSVSLPKVQASLAALR